MKIDELMVIYRRIKEEWFLAPPVGQDCPECDVVFNTGSIIRRRSDFGGLLEVLDGEDCGDVSDFVIEVHNSFPDFYRKMKVMERENELLWDLFGREVKSSDCPFAFNKEIKCIGGDKCEECVRINLKKQALAELKEEGVIVDG